MNKNERISEGLIEVSKKIDEMDVNKPDLMTMVNFVSDEQARIAEKNNKQLAIFSCTALAIMAVLIVLYQLSAQVFVIIQGLFLVVPAILLLLMRGRRNDIT